MLNKHVFRGLKAVLVFDNWPMLVLGRLCDRKTGLVIYRKHGHDILIDHRGGDQCGTRMCIATDAYSRYLPLFHLSGPVRVLDLGANGGGFPLMLSIAGLQIGSAVCVEMNPLTYQRLKLNLMTNFGLSAIPLNAAVCSMPEDSEISFTLTRGGTGDNIYGNRCNDKESGISVRTTTLPALINQYFENEYVDVCKVDIEGAEFEMFESTPDDVMQRLRYLILEIHYFHDSSSAKAQALRERLAALGFSDITIDERNWEDSRGEVRAFAGPAARHLQA